MINGIREYNYRMVKELIDVHENCQEQRNLITRASFARVLAYLRGSFRQLVRGTSPGLSTLGL